MTTIGNTDTIIAGRHVPLTGKEKHRAKAQAVSGRVLANELVTTSDQRRLFMGADLIGPQWLGNVANQAAMLALNTTSAKGAWPGDMCYRTDLATPARLLTNNGGTLTDWFLFPLNTGPTGATGLAGATGSAGAAGASGWTPVIANVANGERRVLQVTDWTGGSGTKPATGYMGATGIVASIASGVDVRGATGAEGSAGTAGATGPTGWTPVLATQADGERRVLQVIDWVGSGSNKPATGTYVGSTGLVATISLAINIRGAAGADGSAGAGGTYSTAVDGGVDNEIYSPGSPTIDGGQDD